MVYYLRHLKSLQNSLYKNDVSQKLLKLFHSNHFKSNVMLCRTSFSEIFLHKFINYVLD